MLVHLRWLFCPPSPMGRKQIKRRASWKLPKAYQILPTMSKENCLHAKHQEAHSFVVNTHIPCIDTKNLSVFVIVHPLYLNILLFTKKFPGRSNLDICFKDLGWKCSFTQPNCLCFYRGNGYLFYAAIWALNSIFCHLRPWVWVFCSSLPDIKCDAFQIKFLVYMANFCTCVCGETGLSTKGQLNSPALTYPSFDPPAFVRS